MQTDKQTDLTGPLCVSISADMQKSKRLFTAFNVTQGKCEDYRHFDKYTKSSL